MKLHDIDQEEAWTGGAMLPIGVHNVTITEAKEGQTSTKKPQIELTFDNGQGASIRDWLTVVPETYGKVLMLLNAAMIEPQSGEWDFDPAVLVGKRLYITVGEEPHYQDATKMVRKVQAYSAAPAKSDIPVDSDIPF